MRYSRFLFQVAVILLSSALARPLVAQTTFGRGVSFMESRIEWHYLPMNDEQYAQALAEVAS